MKRLKLNRWFIAVLTLIMAFLVLSPNKIDPLIVEKAAIPDSDYFMEGVVIHQFNANGELNNRLAANRMEHSSKRDLSLLNNPIITFKNAQSGEWRLASKSGRLLNDGSLLKLDEEVNIDEFQADGSSQTNISTKNLTIDLAANQASTKETVLIKNQYLKTKSTGLEIDFDQQIIYLKSDVITHIY